ncbi:MAG TPA: tetratricopeptide repeat protein [Thermoanaerobaculia bacterium]|nr:tetratricopeptide repeat protein [Thermoanaerobaculia bacterium]
MSLKTLLTLVLACGVLGFAPASPARADVPPPQEYGGRVDPGTFDLPAVQKAYRKILSRWAAGARTESLNDLKTLEAGVIGVDGKGRDKLWKAELQAVRELAEAQHETLLPVMVLHHESYAAYRDLHNPYLSLHARNLTRSLAEVYAARNATEGMRISAARVLTSLGSYIQEASLTELAAELYARSLELDPGNEVALLGLGSLFEKSGRYPPAINYLTRLMKAHPGQAEGKLRLALSLARSGNGKPAEVKKLLRELIVGDAPGWVRDLAYEELGGLLAREGAYAEAEAVFRQGLVRFPGNARLYVELASVLERLGQPGAAVQMAEKVTALAPPREESPRYRYSRWAPEALVALRASLRETSDARLALLAQALGTGKAAG